MKKHVLFVDDERKVLEGLRRMLRGLRHEWDMTFVESGAQALDHLAQSPCDVVVSDMRMPGMDGSQLLREVMNRHPATVRMVLSGQCDRHSVLTAVGPTHQFLTKPCDSEVIKSTVARACRLRDHVTDEHVRRTATCVQSLASPATACRRLVEELEKPAPALDEVGALIAGNVAMSAKALQLVNSGFFGTPQRVTDPRRAAHLLGPETLRDLATTDGMLSACVSDDEGERHLERFLRHSRAVARAARKIVECQTDDPRVAQDAYLAGLLHDVGILVLSQEAPRQYIDALALARREGITLREAERRAFHACRDDVGAYLMGLWGLPNPIVTTIAHHLHPLNSPERAFGPLAAVHAANAFAEADEDPPPGVPEPLDAEYIEQIGCAGRLDAWRDACRELEPQGVSP
ncbi:MAG: HDOD domain-containing protein [Pirellulales bacterium]|nr:HDOD domain-containing protein [Pirellulales bacterium]